MTKEIWFSQATRDIIAGLWKKETGTITSIATKALQTVGIVHAYAREGKAFVALDPSTKSMYWVIRAPQIPDEEGGYMHHYCIQCSDEVRYGLVRVAQEMGCSVGDVLRKGVMLYKTISEHRSCGRTFGIISFCAEVSIPGITTL